MISRKINYLDTIKSNDNRYLSKEVSGIITNNIIDTSGYLNNIILDNTNRFIAMHEPNGFVNRTDSEISFDNSTTTFTISPVGSGYDIYTKGTKKTITNSNSISISATGFTYIYYDSNAVLNTVLNPSSDQTDSLIKDQVLVSLIYYNNISGIIFADERHGITMDGATHHYLHDTIGAVYSDGFALYGYEIDVDTDAALTFELSDGKFYDEDLINIISHGNPTDILKQILNTEDAQVPVIYRDTNGSWVEDPATTLPYKTTGTGRLAYNKDNGDGTYSQVEVDNRDYMTYTLIATNDRQYPIKMIQGQHTYTSTADAKANAANEILSFGDYPTPELIILHRLIMRTSNTYANTKKAKIYDVTDFRKSTIKGVSSTAQDHGTLAGLTDHDHVNYLYKLGEGTGGQYINDNIIINSGLIVSGDIFSHKITIHGENNYDSTLKVVNSATSTTSYPLAIRSETDSTMAPGYGAGIIFQMKDGTVDGNYGIIRAEFVDASNSNIYIGNRKGGTLSDSLTINNAGYIGINNTTPVYHLDVDGSGHLSNNLIIDGNVGIGTSSSSRQLHIHRTGSDAAYAAFTNDTTGLTSEYLIGIDASERAIVWNENNTNLRIGTNDIERITITNTGEVGINETSPNYKLEVNGDSAYDSMHKITTTSTSTVQYPLAIKAASTNDMVSGFGSALMFQMQDNTITGNYGYIKSELIDDNNANIIIGNRKSGTLSDSLTIDNNGNVGIETIPTSKLSIHKSNSNECLLTISNLTTTTSSPFKIGYDANEKAILWNTYNTNLSLATNNAERVTIKSTGEVGINNPSPIKQLDVIGDIQSSNNIAADGNISAMYNGSFGNTLSVESDVTINNGNLYLDVDTKRLYIGEGQNSSLRYDTLATAVGKGLILECDTDIYINTGDLSMLPNSNTTNIYGIAGGGDIQFYSARTEWYPASATDIVSGDLIGNIQFNAFFDSAYRKSGTIYAESISSASADVKLVVDNFAHIYLNKETTVNNNLNVNGDVYTKNGIYTEKGSFTVAAGTTQVQNITVNAGHGTYRISAYSTEVSNGIWTATTTMIIPTNGNVRANVATNQKFQYSGGQITGDIEPYGGANSNGYNPGEYNKFRINITNNDASNSITVYYSIEKIGIIT